LVLARYLAPAFHSPEKPASRYHPWVKLIAPMTSSSTAFLDSSSTSLNQNSLMSSLSGLDWMLLGSMKSALTLGSNSTSSCSNSEVSWNAVSSSERFQASR
jgi:hypothetical protein